MRLHASARVGPATDEDTLEDGLSAGGMAPVVEASSPAITITQSIASSSSSSTIAPRWSTVAAQHGDVVLANGEALVLQVPTGYFCCCCLRCCTSCCCESGRRRPADQERLGSLASELPFESDSRLWRVWEKSVIALAILLDRGALRSISSRERNDWNGASSRYERCMLVSSQITRSGAIVLALCSILAMGAIASSCGCVLRACHRRRIESHEAYYSSAAATASLIASACARSFAPFTIGSRILQIHSDEASLSGGGLDVLALAENNLALRGGATRQQRSMPCHVEKYTLAVVLR